MCILKIAVKKARLSVYTESLEKDGGIFGYVMGNGIGQSLLLLIPDNRVGNIAAFGRHGKSCFNTRASTLSGGSLLKSRVPQIL